MGGTSVKISDVIQATKDAFMEAEGVDAEDDMVLALLRDEDVDREDLALAVEKYPTDQTDALVHFDSVEWEEFTDALQKAAPGYV